MRCCRSGSPSDGSGRFVVCRSLVSYSGISGASLAGIWTEIREASWHNPPEPVLAIWLNGETEFDTSDGEIRRLGPGSAVLAEDTWGKGHISLHPAVEQRIIII